MLTITDNLYYMAPEELDGGGYSEAVDVWSVGIILYKLVTGYTPFEANYRAETIDKIAKAEVVFPA
jgi:serine/threonine protein kinase